MPIRIFLKFLLTSCGFLAFLVLLAVLLEPDADPSPIAHTADEITAAAARRSTHYDTGHPPVINQQVDYSEGTSAAWYPKEEAPILAGWVAQGVLPPVAERVGPEPVVMLGVDGLGRYGGTWMQGTNAARNVDTFGTLYADAQLVRWSPLGEM